MRGFKTFLYGIALILISILSNEEVVGFLTDNFRFTVAGIGVLVIILRAITDSPMFNTKKPDGEKLGLLLICAGSLMLAGCAGLGDYLDVDSVKCRKAVAAAKTALSEGIDAANTSFRADMIDVETLHETYKGFTLADRGLDTALKLCRISPDEAMLIVADETVRIGNSADLLPP